MHVSFISRPDRNEYLNITRDSYFPTLVYYSSWWGPFMGKKKKKERGRLTTLYYTSYLWVSKFEFKNKGI